MKKSMQPKSIKPAVDMQMLGKLAIGLVIAGITTAVGLKVLEDVKDSVTDAENVSSGFTNATNDALLGGANLSNNFGIIGTIIGLSVVIGLLVGAFGFFKN